MCFDEWNKIGDSRNRREKGHRNIEFGAVPRPVVNTCIFIAAANCSVPQTKSLAGVAAKIRPFFVTLSPGPKTL